MSQMSESFQEPDEDGNVVDQQNADVAAGPVTGSGVARPVEDANPGHPAAGADPNGAGPSSGEAISRSGTGDDRGREG
jgi:hypothetical protein